MLIHYLLSFIFLGVSQSEIQSNYQTKLNMHVIDVLNYYSQYPNGKLEATSPMTRSLSIVMNSFWRKVLKITTPVDPTMPLYQLAADPRRNMDLVRSVLDMPINIVSLSCYDTVSEKKCFDKITKMTDTQIKYCPGYMMHQDFYDETVELFTSETFGEFDMYVRSYLKGSTDDAISKILANELLESAHAEKFIEWGSNFTKRTFPCNKVQMMVVKHMKE